MTLEEDCGYTWRCDDCGRAASFPGYEFWHALSELKARSWRIARSYDGEWVHTCSQCSRKQAANVADFLNRKPRASQGELAMSETHFRPGSKPEA
jgi:hypothetical protein